MNMEYDSADPNKSGGMMGPTMKALVDAEFHTIYGKDGEFLEIQGLDKIKDAAQLGLGREQFELMAKQTSLLLPGKNVEPGDTWSAELEFPLKPITDKPGTLKMDLKLESIDEENGSKIAKISMTGSLEMNIEDGGKQVLTMKAKKIEGSMRFDVGLGQAVESRTTMDLEMGLPAGLPNQEGGAGTMPVKALAVNKLKGVEKVPAEEKAVEEKAAGAAE